MKKLLAILTLFLAANAFADTWTDPDTGYTWTYQVNGGNAEIINNTGSQPPIAVSITTGTFTGALMIPSSIGGYPVTSIGNEAFLFFGGLTSVTIPDSVTSIGSMAFAWCSDLASVTIPNSVTNIGNYAFAFCSALTSVTIPDSVTSIGYGAFSDCNDSLFDRASFPGITVVDGWAIGTTDTLSGALNLSGLRGIADSAFQNCRTLTSVTISDSVTSIGDYAFSGCSGLTNVTISDSVTSIGYGAFYECSGLTSVTIPDSVTSIGDWAFSGCSSLTSVTIPDSVTSIGDVTFGGCNSLTSVTIPDSVTSIGDGAFSDCSDLTSVTISDSVTSIGVNAFYGCSSLTNVTIPDNVKEIWDFAFGYCSSLTSVTIPEGVTDISYGMFYGCSSLSSVTIPDSVTHIWKDAFYGCNSLTNMTIPKKVTTIDMCSFGACSGLVQFDVANDNPNYKDENGLLFSKDGKTLVVGVNGDVVIPDGVTIIGDSAFAGFAGLTSVMIPNGVTCIDPYAFYGCTALTSVTIPNSVTSIWDWAFCSCTNLRYLTMPYGVVLEKTAPWEYGAFENAPLLQLTLAEGATAFDTGYLVGAGAIKYHVSILEIPASVTNVQRAAINQLVNLTKIIFHGDSLQAVSEEDLAYLRSVGIDLESIDESGSAAEIVESAVSIVRYGVREDDPAVFDVVYVASNAVDTVEIRVLAFEDGERSFAKVLRPETFIEGTGENVGEGVAANIEHTLSWRVSADWDVELARVSVEVMMLDDHLLPLKLLKIPATAQHGAMQFSCNPLTPSKVLDALFWEYADAGSGLTVDGGVLRAGGDVLADGAEPTAKGTGYIFGRMGFSVLEGDELEYANGISRLGLVPEGVRQYGVRNLED